jgi:hypothetical protein
LIELVHATLSRVSVWLVLTFALVTTTHEAPFQCSVRVCLTGTPLTQSPTAQQSDGLAQETERRMLLVALLFGLGTIVQDPELAEATIGPASHAHSTEAATSPLQDPFHATRVD